MITITIPTKGRPGALSRCLSSIDYPQCFVRVGAVTIDDVMISSVKDRENISVSFGNDSIIETQNNLAFASPDESHILPASDDIRFMPGAIAAAKEVLFRHFPDSDGVVGFNIINMNEKDRSPFAFMLIGSKFFNSRLNRELFYPGYKHFYADTELGLFAQSLNRFVFSYQAQLLHYHPATGALMDHTYLNNRGEKWIHDNNLFNQRVKNGENTRFRLHADMPIPPEAR